MGLDIYVGTLTRYYTHNWKTITQKYAKMTELEFQKFDDNKELSIEDTKEFIMKWRDSIIIGLDLDPAPIWNEDYDETPYYTNKLDRIAVDAFMLYIAAKYLHKEVPTTIEKNINIYEQPIIKDFLKTKGFQLTLFDGSGWWLPIIQPSIFQYVLPNSKKGYLSSNVLLMAELKRYNAFEWNADRDTIISWSRIEPYHKEDTIYNTISLAKFAFSILWQAAEFSLEHSVVIVYDYK